MAESSPAPDLTQLFHVLQASEADLRIDALYYLLASLDPEERESLLDYIEHDGREELVHALHEAQVLGPNDTALSQQDLGTFSR